MGYHNGFDNDYRIINTSINAKYFWLMSTLIEINDITTASKNSSFMKFTAESRHNRSRGIDPCDNNIIVDTAYCNVVSFNKIFAFH